MTNEEVLTKYINVVRNQLNLDIYPNYVEKLCNECDILSFLFAIKNNLPYEQIHFTNLGFIEPFHRCSLIGLPNQDDLQWYLIDPTYGQFFEDENFKNYMFKQYPQFTNELLTKGFITCNISTLSCYFNGFLYSKTFPCVDSNFIYENITDLLIKNKIINIHDTLNYHK